jgi:hypothetical protein
MILSFMCLIFLSACSMNHHNSQQQNMSDTIRNVQDTISGGKSLNDIRFEGWDRHDWMDNDYIRTLREYLDEYNSGKVDDPDLEPYKDMIKGKFVIYDINPYLLGGAFIRVTFIDSPDRVFDCWVYSNVDEENEVVESYELRSITIEDENTGMTKEEILNIVKMDPEIKLW